MPARPISEKRLAAHRANALKSTGPRTQEGKRRSSQNSRTHGLYTTELALPELWQRPALDFAARAAAQFAADPILAHLVAQRALLRVHNSYAISLATAFADAMFAAPAPLAYRIRHGAQLAAIFRCRGRIRRRIRALERELFPALRQFEAARTKVLPKAMAAAAAASSSLQRGNETNPTQPPHPRHPGAVSSDPATKRTQHAPARCVPPSPRPPAATPLRPASPLRTQPLRAQTSAPIHHKTQPSAHSPPYPPPRGSVEICNRISGSDILVMQ